MYQLIGLLRIALSAGIITAVIATYLDISSRTEVVFFNFFGYFTIQSNLATAAVLGLSGVLVIAGREQGQLLQQLRAAVTTYIIIVGIVYAVLLAPLGEAGGVPVPWANTVLHVVAPIVAAIDWVLSGDRQRLPFSTLWLILAYPIVWLGVVLYRGASDGWVPYPFLDPAQGYEVVAAYAAAIAAVFALIGALVLLVSRQSGLIKPASVLRQDAGAASSKR